MLGNTVTEVSKTYTGRWNIGGWFTSREDHVIVIAQLIEDMIITVNVQISFRSVVVAGGTMQPISEFQDQLFLSAGGEVSRVQHFSCGHVVPANQLLPIILPQGPTGVTLDFTFQHRAEPKVVSVQLVICNSKFCKS